MGNDTSFRPVLAAAHLAGFSFSASIENCTFHENKIMWRNAGHSASLYHRKRRHSYREIGPSSVVGWYCFVKKVFNLSSFCCDVAEAGWSNVSVRVSTRDRASATLFCLPGTYLMSICYTELWDKIPVSKFTYWALLAIALYWNVKAMGLCKDHKMMCFHHVSKMFYNKVNGKEFTIMSSVFGLDYWKLLG